MRIRTLFLGSFALASMLLAQSCSEKNDEPSGAPSIELSASSVSFEKDGGDQVIQVTATRDWKVEMDADWVAVDPKKGSASEKASDVTVSVNPNTGLDRSATVKFTIGFETKTLTVNQKGTGSASELVVYHNDFDKEEATKTFGTSKSSWPYLDQFEGWKNATGTGLGSEKYSYSGMSVRANSTSNGNYSDYSGSGSNNLFFGANAYFSVQGLKLSSDLNYTLTFGAEKYSQDNGSLFKHDEFHVYISNDAKKWVELEYVFPNGDKEGKWDCATSNFTIPSGTSALSIYVKTDVASSYRLDDLKLSIASAAGTAIDFSKGIDLGTGSGETPEPGTDYSKAESKTVADFIAAANKTTYYKLKGTVSGFNSQYCSFDLTDATGKIYVYSVANKAEWSSKVKNGGTVELAGLYDYYETKSQHEVVNAQILSFTEGETPAPSEIKDATVAEFLAAETSGTVLYRLTGEITEIKNTTYGNLMLKDATGEVLIYGVKKDKDASNTSFSELGAEVGDKLTVVGNRDEYNGEKEMKNGYCEKLEKDTTTPKFSVSKETLSVASTATTASFDVKGNVKWTVASDNAAYAVSPASGEGNGTVTVKFAANETDKDVTVKLTVSTSADVATKSYTVTLTHKKKSSSSAKFVKVTTAPADWSGTYLIVNEDENVALKGSLTADVASNNIAVTPLAGEIDATDELLAETVVIAAVDGGYSVKSASGKYIYGIASKNAVNYSDSYGDAQLNTITLDTTDGVIMTSGTAVMRYNAQSGQKRFRYFKSATYKNQKAVQLYKLSE